MIREQLSPEERARPTRHYIDPGFVNHRLVETVLGEAGAAEINRRIALLPSAPDWLRTTQISHVYARTALDLCEALPAPSLRELLGQGRGRLFCSTEYLNPITNLYETPRATVPIPVAGFDGAQAVLEFGTDHISSDTFRSYLHQGTHVSIIAVLHQARSSILTFRPLIMGLPWLESDDVAWSNRVVWFGMEFYEQFLEDFDEFAEVTKIPLPSQQEADVLHNVSEKAFKACLAEILGGTAAVDWGGEMSDLYTAHLHLQGRRVSAAFLLKGPAKFGPMGLNHLGKNNDQIFRLAQEPADVLFVQHCHDIAPPVRATLRAFAVQPSRPRRYCLIDGRDSLRLLKAYGKLDRSLSLSSGVQQ